MNVPKVARSVLWLHIAWSLLPSLAWPPALWFHSIFANHCCPGALGEASPHASPFSSRSQTPLKTGPSLAFLLASIAWSSPDLTLGACTKWRCLLTTVQVKARQPWSPSEQVRLKCCPHGSKQITLASNASHSSCNVFPFYSYFPCHTCAGWIPPLLSEELLWTGSSGNLCSHHTHPARVKHGILLVLGVKLHCQQSRLLAALF